VKSGAITQVIPAGWVDVLGDLDRDGKPDALVTCLTDSSEYPVLYLSSKARKGKLLQAVALMGGRFVD